MNTHLTTDDPSTLLRRALVANALFSGASGTVLALGARPVASFLGVDAVLFLAVTGVLLILYAADLLYVATRPAINRTAAWMAVVLDLLWVAGSALILLGGWLPLTTGGQWAAAIVAELVFLFALFQYLGLRRLGDDS
ncbi:MAG: hypothetical protein R3248_07475 [Candidatus Promineifilaceae bacterium]|nr:hypothetical protein [Candidatus Promineifilaceae bacterium]